MIVAVLGAWQDPPILGTGQGRGGQGHAAHSISGPGMAIPTLHWQRHGTSGVTPPEPHLSGADPDPGTEHILE